MTTFKMSPVLMLFKKLPNKKYLITIFKVCLFFVNFLHFAFGENRVILLQTVAK